MNRRFILALATVALLAASAGCLGYVTGGGEIANETLDAEPPGEYPWSASTDVRIDVRNDGTYLAVYNTTGHEEVRLFEETGYGTEDPLQPRAFRYRYANGTVINGSQFRARGGEIEQTTDEVWVRFDDGMTNGSIAYAGDGSPRRFITRTYITGSYTVQLPEGFTTGIRPFGHASPSGYEATSVDGRERLVWEEVTTSVVVVQAYRRGDLPVFGAIAVVAIVIGTAGYLYFRRQLTALRDRRREMGLEDVESDLEDLDDDDGPPPGMR
ncbi:hypothetical protein SAMN05192561_101910 [Halopenitus malekzadehii]|uniref:Uncharacterized protein n=1 Tax=Halopenitus malekzadehii TaxID=1267564 RepID=A0A1H6I191_9EURY|nr:DUF5803 family protein [Halopenitus malekzadehii]SEH42485.1 hypothetical protein SAMN05192561_101910 [Halopenitus malekzadehii]